MVLVLICGISVGISEMCRLCSHFKLLKIDASCSQHCRAPMSIPAIPVILVAGVAVGAASFQIISISVLVLVLLLCGAIMTCFIVGQRSVHFLGQDEQLLVEGFTGMYVQNGPGTFILNPFTHRSASVRKAETLGTMDYLKVRHAVEGKERIEKGPQLFFLAPYEQIVERSKGLSLGSTEYALIKDLLTGERRIIKGPCMWFPGPHEDAQRGAAVSLSRTEYLIVEDIGWILGECVCGCYLSAWRTPWSWWYSRMWNE